MKTHTIIALLLFSCFTYGQTYTDNDSDGDSYSNVDEINGGSDPLDPDSTLNVEFYQDTFSFTIYPNPVEHTLYISTVLDEPLEVYVYDVIGKN